MNNLIVKTGEIKIIQSQKRKAILKIYLSKNEAGLEKKLPKLFGIFWIESNQKNIEDLINLIIEDLENNFFQKDEKINNLNFSLEDLDKRFEKAIQKVNIGLINFIKSHQIIIELEKINIILGVLYQQNLILTPIGKLEAFLFHYRHKGNYQIINILDSAELIPINPLKFFSQTISGKISPRDTLFLSTPMVLDYFSLEKIKNIIAEDSLEKVTAHLKKLLEEIDTKNNFAVLLMRLEKILMTFKPITEEKIDYLKLASEDSMKELIRTEKLTEKFLTPSILPEIKKYAKYLKESFQKYLIKIKKVPSPKRKQPVSKIVNKVIDKTKNVTFPLNKKVSEFFKKLEFFLIIKKILNYLLQIINYLTKKFKLLSTRRKILLALSLILISIFSFNVFYLSIKKFYQKKTKFYNDIIATVEQIKNESEASLIYRDENKARELLLKSQELLEQLKAKSKEKQEKITQLNQEIEEQLEKLKHLVNIIEPIMIANFENLDSEAEIANLILRLGNNLYTQNYHNKTIYKVNFENRLISLIPSGSFEIDTINLGISTADDKLLFYNNNKKMIEFNASENSFKLVNIELLNKMDFKALDIYHDYLYFLDSTNNQIYRYSKTSTGFSPAIAWIKNPEINLKEIISMTVDGNIYLLKANGEILKFSQGEIQDFNYNIYPSLKEPTKIKTLPESNYLYILEPVNKRLVVINKEGKLINQYYSQNFNNLKDFVIIEKEKKIYLLDGNKIFGIATVHL